MNDCCLTTHTHTHVYIYIYIYALIRIKSAWLSQCLVFYKPQLWLCMTVYMNVAVREILSMYMCIYLDEYVGITGVKVIDNLI